MKAGGSSPKQVKITSYTGLSKILHTAVNLAVHNGVPFSIFDVPDMRVLTTQAKIGIGDESARVVSSSNVKMAIKEIAKEKRDELRQLLKGKVINLTADFATCERRSFLGKLETL